MSRRTILKLLPLAVVILIPLAWVKPEPTATVGPPWLSIEVPANPFERSAKGAVLFVHAYRHGDQVGFPVSGTAWGLVNGERQSIELEFTRTSKSGLYALKQQWPSQGHWVLGISLSAHDKADASLVIQLGPNGGVTDDDYYGMATKALTLGSVRLARGGVDNKKIDASLRAMAMASGE